MAIIEKRRAREVCMECGHCLMRDNYSCKVIDCSLGRRPQFIRNDGILKLYRCDKYDKKVTYVLR